MSVSREDLYRLIDTIPEEKLPIVRRFLELIGAGKGSHLEILLMSSEEMAELFPTDAEIKAMMPTDEEWKALFSDDQVKRLHRGGARP